MERHRSHLVWLFLVALLIRIAYWIVAPPAAASDSVEFLEAARGVAAGQWSALREYPFHAVYALLLAPAFWSGAPLQTYVAVLHTTLSAGSVVLVALIAASMSADRLAPSIAGAAAAIYPTALFWMPYILTETAFLFMLLAFTWATIQAIRRPAIAAVVSTAIVGAVLFFLRPVAITVVTCGLGIAAFAAWPVLSARRPRMARWAALVALFVFAAASVAIVARRDALVRIPTVGQTLWLSTNVVHGAQAELAQARIPPEARDLPLAEQYAYKARVATRFIADHPARYLSMAAQRFVSFWMPSLYLDWSPRHRVVDFTTMLVLLVAAGCSFTVGAKHDAWAVVVAFALALTLESAFGQIDADARYRFPAEALLVAPAAVAIAAALRRITSAPVVRPESIA